MLVHSFSCRILVALFRLISGVPRCFALGGKKRKEYCDYGVLIRQRNGQKMGRFAGPRPQILQGKTDTKSQMSQWHLDDPRGRKKAE